MKVLHVLTSAFWLLILVIACNTTPAEPKEENKEAASNTDASEDKKDSKETKVETSLEGESFPTSGGFKGRNGDYIFYVEVTESAVTGFVRHKDAKTENKVSGRKTSPFDFEAEETDENGDKLAKLRGKLSDDETAAELDYSDTNNGNTFRLELKK